MTVAERLLEVAESTRNLEGLLDELPNVGRIGPDVGERLSELGRGLEQLRVRLLALGAELQGANGSANDLDGTPRHPVDADIPY